MSGDSESSKIKAIPYGISDYGRIRRKNHYYVDKTSYLETLQTFGSYLFFIRPRRFGKSLFITLMEAYFDVYYKDRFDELFKGTWIYDHPTDEKHQYLVLVFNFSLVDPAADKLEISFLDHVRGLAVAFIQKYHKYLSTNSEMNYYSEIIKESHSASDILANLLALCKGANQLLYVIIDEYDNFTNTVLSTVGKDAYHNLTQGAGFFRPFFNILKGSTGIMDAPIDRLFITGVSPITMDDVTSGFNIGKNVSSEPAFNRMLGFTRDDVIRIIEYYRSNGLVKHPTDYLLDIMAAWYGNYRFSEYGDDDIKMFNADMVLYFMDNYLTKQDLPNDLIDRNVRVDYGKLRHLIMVDKGKGKTLNGNFGKLKKIIEQGRISAKLVKGFPLEELADTDNFVSLLFYFGLLTIENTEKGKMNLVVPNETMNRLYYDYIKRGYREAGIFDLDLQRYTELFSDMAYDGKWKPLFDYITGRMKESMSLRDLITGEKSIQAFLNVYLGLSDLYIIHTEKELNKGYADIVMEPFLARYEGIKFSYLIELKYITAGYTSEDAEVLQLKTKAEEQLKQYCIDEKFKKALEKTTLIKIAAVFSGHDAIYTGEVD